MGAAGGGGAGAAVVDVSLAWPCGRERHTGARKLGAFVGHEGDVSAVTPSPDGRTLVSGSNDQTVRLWNLATRELIVTLFHGRDGEWVMWTPQGYFIASPGAGYLVGWQQKLGLDKEATYVKAIQLRHLLNRPDIVERAIVLADANAAVAELAGTGPTLAELVRSPPPHVFVAGDITSSTGRATIVLEVERTSRTVDAWDVHLGDRDKSGTFVAERKLAHRVVPVPAGYKPTMENRELLALEVNLRRGTNQLGVVARTAVGETPMSVTQIIVSVRRRPPCSGDSDSADSLLLVTTGEGTALCLEIGLHLATT